jgi:hypothetical protein
VRSRRIQAVDDDETPTDGDITMTDMDSAVWNDANGDGVGDSTAFDSSGNGLVDTTMLDADFNGQVDIVGYDTDENGLSNIIDIDTNTDGVLDTRFVDADGNGLMDRMAGPTTGNVQIVIAENPPQAAPYDPGMSVIGGGNTNPLLNSEVIMNDPFGRDAVIKILDSQNDAIENILSDDDDDN